MQDTSRPRILETRPNIESGLTGRNPYAVLVSRYGISSAIKVRIRRGDVPNHDRTAHRSEAAAELADTVSITDLVENIRTSCKQVGKTRQAIRYVPSNRVGCGTCLNLRTKGVPNLLVSIRFN